VTADIDDTLISEAKAADSLELSTNDGETWQAYTANNPVTGNESVSFRRKVTLENCGPLEVIRQVNFRDYCENTSQINTVHNNRANTVSATATDSLNSTVQSEVFEASVDGAAFAPYTSGETITGFSSVSFRRTLTFTNSCPDVVTEANVFKVEETGQPCNNAVDITLTEVAPCVFIPELGGTNESQICNIVWELSNDNGVTWRPWDFYPIESTPGTKIRAAIQFCDFCPPQFIEKNCPFE